MMVLAQALPDIAPPVSYSLVPPWVIFVASLIALTIIGLAIWYGRRFFRKKEVALSPRERALAALNGIATEVEKNFPFHSTFAFLVICGVILRNNSIFRLPDKHRSNF